MPTGSGFTPAADAPCYNPRMTRAAALALAAGAGLRENCVVVVTDGPTIGTASLTSPTEIELNPVSPTELGMPARVHTTFDTTAWTGIYDVVTGLLVRLEDNLGNIVDDPTGVNIATAFPWGRAAVTRNIILGSATLTGWDAPAVAGGAIRANSILTNTDTLVNLSGMTLVGDIFSDNVIQEADVKITTAGAGYDFSNNDVRDDFVILLAPVLPVGGVTIVEGNHFQSHGGGLEATPDDLSYTGTGMTLQVVDSNFEARSTVTSWSFAGTAGLVVIEASTFIGNATTAQLTRTGVGSFTAQRTSFNGGIWTVLIAAGSFTVSQCQMISGTHSFGGATGIVSLTGTEWTVATVTRDNASTGNFIFTRGSIRNATLTQGPLATAGALSLTDSNVLDGFIVNQNGTGAVTVGDSTLANHGSATADLNQTGAAGININDSILISAGAATPVVDNSSAAGTLSVFRTTLNGSLVTKVGVGPLSFSDARFQGGTVTIGAANAGSTNAFNDVDVIGSTFTLNGPLAGGRNDFTAGARFASTAVTVAATATAGVNIQGGDLNNATGVVQNQTVGTASMNLFACSLRGFSSITDNCVADPGVAGVILSRVTMVDSVMTIAGVSGKTGAQPVCQQVDMLGSTLTITASVGSTANDFHDKVRLHGASVNTAGFHMQNVIIEGLPGTKTLTAFNLNRLANKSFDDIL